MSIPVCPREAEALEAVLGGGWPSGVDADLRVHVDSCPVCSEVVSVAVAMQDEHTLACQQAQVPSAGLVWWRAERRARQEAARKAARPMTFVQVVAGACGAGAALTMGGLMSSWVRSTLSGFVDAAWLHVPAVDTTALTGVLTQSGSVLLLAVGAWVVLVPVALYVALSRD
jgi:hypothetical protein